MFILTILEKTKETTSKFSKGSETVLQKTGNQQQGKVKLTNTQLSKLKDKIRKNKIGTILRLNKKKFEDEELPHELFLTTKQTTKIINAFANNMPTDIKT